MQNKKNLGHPVTIVLCLLLFPVLVQGVAAESSCTFIRMWGSYEGGPSTTSNGVAADASDKVYVTDTGNNRILVFSSDGSILSRWNLNWTEPEKLDVASPYGIAVDSSHNVYITDRENNTVQKYTPWGLTTIWGSEGTGDGQFSHPTGVAVDSSANVYVADTGNNRIQKFHSTGTYLMQWGSYGTPDGSFNAPMDVTVDSSGHVYVADTGNKRIQKFSPDGTFLVKWGTSGTGEGQFSTPTGIAVDSKGNVYVADLTSRVQEFNPAGEFLTTCDTGATTNDVAVDPSGTIYALLQSGPHWKIGKYGTRDSASLAASTPGVHTTFSVFVEQTTPRVTPTTSLMTAPPTSPATIATPTMTPTTRVTIVSPTLTPTMDSDTKIAEPGEQPAENERILEEQGNILDQITAFLGKLLGRK